MSQIKIHLGNVNDVSSKMSRYVLEVSDIKRELEIVKWKLDRDVMGQNGLLERYEDVLRELRRAEEDMERIKQHIRGGVEAYRRNEQNLINRQNDMGNRFI